MISRARSAAKCHEEPRCRSRSNALERKGPMKNVVLAVSISLFAVAGFTSAAVENHAPLAPAFVRASHLLEFSGAIVSVEEDYRHTAWPIARRIFLLKGANGRRIALRLHVGGGKAENDSLNLFRAANDSYFLTSERDCVEFNPVKVSAGYCATRPFCRARRIVGLSYLGRFDWMNGFDPPKGLFRLRFRYLSAEDAIENDSCPSR